MLVSGDKHDGMMLSRVSKVGWRGKAEVFTFPRYIQSSTQSSRIPLFPTIYHPVNTTLSYITMSSTAIPGQPTIEDYRRQYTFPLDFASNWHDIGTLKAREEHVRESWIKAMEARIVRGELQKCYRGEGVNQLQNCKELAERYASMIRENKVSRFWCFW